MVGNLGQRIETIDGGDDFTATFFNSVSAVRRIVFESSITMTFKALECCSIMLYRRLCESICPFGRSKPLILKGQYHLAAFLAQSPNPIYRATFAVVFP